jgi:hypothetical protein
VSTDYVIIIVAEVLFERSKGWELLFAQKNLLQTFSITYFTTD